MDASTGCIGIAGILMLLTASSNLFAARMLDYRGNLARVSPIVRDIFWVQNLFIEIVLVGFAFACFFFAADLAGQSSFGRFFSGFLALFWGLRLLIQLFFYDASMRRRHRGFDMIFLVAQTYLTAVFTAAALGWLRSLP